MSDDKNLKLTVSLPLGEYTHFKGGHYRVFALAKHSETQEPMVVYTSLKTGEFWVRPLGMWLEHVEWPDGQRRPRFVPV